MTISAHFSLLGQNIGMSTTFCAYITEKSHTENVMHFLAKAAYTVTHLTHMAMPLLKVPQELNGHNQVFFNGLILQSQENILVFKLFLCHMVCQPLLIFIFTVTTELYMTGVNCMKI